MRSLARVFTILGVVLCTGLAALPARMPAQAAPAPGGPGALRVRAGLLGAHQQLTFARGLLSQGNATAMSAAIARGVLDLERTAALLRAGAASPLSQAVAALLADFTTTDLSEDPELAGMLLERGCAELEELLTPAGGVGPQSGAAGRISLNPPSADFGILCPGEEREVQIQVTNKTSTERRLDLPTSGVDPFSLTEDSPRTVAAGETVTLTVRFKIDTLGRYRKAMMLHAVADGQRDAGIFLNVTATVRTLLVEPNLLDFGEVTIGESRTMTVTLRNCLDQQVQPFLRFPNATSRAFTFAPGQAQQVTIPAGGTVQVSMVFTPTVVPEVTGTMQVFVPSARRMGDVIGSGNLRGRGKEPVKVGATKLNFGTVAAGQFHTRTVGIENNTGDPQEVTIDRTKLHAEYWSVSPVGAVKLPPNSVTQVSLRFGAIGRCQHRGTLMVKGAKLKRGKASVAVSVLSR